jgi:hypothetical protein
VLLWLRSIVVVLVTTTLLSVLLSLAAIVTYRLGYAVVP